ncbi:MAG: hypothetical protein R3C02_23935 [Planctomycetaceae bacterium]
MLSKIDGNAEAVGTITGAVTGTTTEGITPRRMPSETVFDYYLRNGTWIDFDSLENGGGGNEFEMLSSVLNSTPLGPRPMPRGSTSSIVRINSHDREHPHPGNPRARQLVRINVY